MGSPRENREKDTTAYDTPSSAGLQDTVMLVAAVEFPLSYDWQRDSAYGNVSCTLRLFQGSKEQFSIPAGLGTTVGASPDGHHIIDGSLFSVYSDERGTYVGCNGITLCHWAEREIVSGLICSDGDLYTVGMPHSGEGIIYRRNGQELLRDASGLLFGGFGNDTYGTTGALYRDGPDICFAYACKGEKSSQIFFVRNGSAGSGVTVQSRKLLDAKIIDGTEAALYNQVGHTMLRTGSVTRNITVNTGVYWTDAGIIRHDGRFCAAGRCDVWRDHTSAWGIGGDGYFLRIDAGTDYLYFHNGTYLPLDLSRYSDCCFFGRNCACTLNGELALALTPKDPMLRPYTLYRGNRTEYPIFGFISCIGPNNPE